MPEHWRFDGARLPDAAGWLRRTVSDRVAVCARSHPAVAALLPASAAVGADLAFIPRDLPRAAVAERLVDLGEPPLVSDRDDLADHPLRTWPETDAPTGGAPAAPSERGGLLVPTSGSTVDVAWHRLAWPAVAEAAATGAAACGMAARDVWLLCLPLEHVGGSMLYLRAVHAGCDLVLCERFDAGLVSDLIDAEGIVGLSLVPTMLRRLVERRRGRAFPNSLAHLIVGGASCDGRLREAAGALGRFPRLSYGLTETCAMVTLQTPAQAAAGPGCGLPLPGRDVRIREARSTTSQSGETAAAGAIQVRTPTTGAGWYPTGDLGWRLPDGQLQVVGRISTRIVSGGITLAAEAIEDVLRHHPAVADAAVCGLPDEEWGEIVAAVVVGQETDIGEWCRARMERAARPKRIVWVDKLPLLASGKPDRRKVRVLLDGAGG